MIPNKTPKSTAELISNFKRFQDCFLDYFTNRSQPQVNSSQNIKIKTVKIIEGQKR